MELEALKKPVITLGDVAKVRNISRASAGVAITRLAKKGKILKLEKGKYAISNDVFAVASNITHPCYISFAAALYLRGMLQQTVSEIAVMSPKTRKPLEFFRVRIRFVRTSTKNLFGYERIRRGGFFAFVAEPEKAVVDIVCNPSYYPLSYLDEVVGSIDVEKLERYLLRLGSVSAIKRVGYILEKNGLRTGLRKNAKLLRGVHYLIPGKGSTWNKKWRLYV